MDTQHFYIVAPRHPADNRRLGLVLCGFLTEGFYFIFTTVIPLIFSPSLQKYVREQILLAVAVIVKRGTVDKSINCKSIFHEVGQLISSGNPTMVRRRVCLFMLDMFPSGT